MSKLSDLHVGLQAEWGRVQAFWRAAREQWRDEVADNFERRHWQEWDQQTAAFLRAFDELEEIVNSALQDTA
jgi:hypothetical protein